MAGNIFICGNFGYQTNQLDGQTIKTRMVKDQLILKLGQEKITFLDTAAWITKPFSLLTGIWINFRNSKNIFIMPGENGLKVILPLIILLQKIYKNKGVYYIVIGGWLPDALKNSTKYRKYCGLLSKIYVETNQMKDRILKLGLKNVEVLPNFKSFPILDKEHLPKSLDLPLKAVFLSRVVKEKGVEMAIEAIKKANEKRSRQQITLDIYGPISSEYKKDFDSLMATAPDYIKYKGTVHYADTITCLRNYDLMLFPTYYKGEGFPGALIDALAAGVPVLASDWKYNAEIITENQTGFLFKAMQQRDLNEKLTKILINRTCLLEMKENCLNQAKNYHANVVINKIVESLR